jgi:molybdopterin biosynthesis enzyme MoaB
MTKVTTYEGNTIRVEREYESSDTFDTTLSGFSVYFILKENKDDTAFLVTATGTVTGDGVVFNIPCDDNTLSHGTYYFEINAESDTNKVTLEQDRLFIKESIKYIS